MKAEWKNRYDAMVLAAQKAGRHALRYYDSGVNVEWKADSSPVTRADREAETMLHADLVGSFADDGFLGEEFGDRPGTSGFRWIIDPIDGTRSFVRGIPIWATLVGLAYRDGQIAGVADPPAVGMTCRSLRGGGAVRRDRRMARSERPT